MPLGEPAPVIVRLPDLSPAGSAVARCISSTEYMRVSSSICAAAAAACAILCSFTATIDAVALDFLLGKLPSWPAISQYEIWGDADENVSAAPKRHVVSIKSRQLADLRTRLTRRRSYPQMAHANWSYGIDGEYLDGLVQYWEKEYSWRTHEAELNRIGLLSLVVDGLTIVFHQLRAPLETQEEEPPERLGLLLLHGWPGSILEFRRLIGLLSTPGSAHHLAGVDLVVPCLPGYGFSSAPTREGYGVFPMARTLHRLMLRLGYSHFVVQGGDWGSIVAQAMAVTHPAPLVGLHLNFFPCLPAGPVALLLDLLKIRFFDTAESRARHARMNDLGAIWQLTGYFHQQATKPETLGAALADSPVGLAAWIVEKFQSWSDGARPLESKFSRDDLLSNVMIYWLTNSIVPSMRLYKEFARASDARAYVAPLAVPVGLSLFPHEIAAPPDAYIRRRFADIVTMSHHKVGGHFAALERPEALASDVAEFLRALRAREASEEASRQTSRRRIAASRSIDMSHQ